MGQPQTKELLYNKGNHQQSKETNQDMGENICKPTYDKRFISKMYKDFKQQKESITHLKMCKRAEWMFLKRRCMNHQQVCEHENTKI